MNGGAPESDVIVFLEHPEIPEQWRKMSGDPRQGA
jgi:hypothetical protein